MLKSKASLFESVREPWPKQLTILIGETTVDRVSTSPCISEIYHSIDEKISSDDELKHLAVWAFYQALNKLGRRKAKSMYTTLLPQEVSFRSFNTHMLSNLREDCWENERELWERLPDRLQ
jgi:hypothetical protein